MSTDPRSILGTLLVLLVLTAFTLPATGQEAEGDEDEIGFGEIFAEFGMWVAQPAGLEYQAASLADPDDPFNTRVLNPTHGTEGEMRYRGGYELSRNVGGLILTYYAQEELTSTSLLRPSEFVYGELLAHPLYAGYANNGLADGFDQETDTLLRDFRLDFYRTAFRSGRVIGKWFAGYRRVHHYRSQDVAYYGLAPEFPALVPPLTDPRPDLDPLPDEVGMASQYTGRGLEGGMDFEAPFWRDRLWVEGGFAVAALRGKVDSQYRSTTHYYLLSIPQQDPEILAPPYDQFSEFTISGDPPEVNATVDWVTQENYEIGLNTTSRSQDSSILEAYLGFRARLAKNLELFGGFRSTRYDGVGIDLRPKNIVVTDVTSNYVDVEETERSATYEGFYGGVAVRF